MRRTHNVALLTLLFFAIVLFLAHSNNEEPLSDTDAIVHNVAHSALKAGSPGATASTPSLTRPSPVSVPINSDAVTFPASSKPEEAKHEIFSPPLEIEYPFQEDLNLDLPVEIFQGLASHRPMHYDPDGPKTYAYATFMATHNPSLKDPYYLAVHSIIYRLLWAPRSKTTRYPLVVFVAPFVTSEQRALLVGAGAIVRELALVDWEANVPGMQKRWRDQFSKLHMWKETDFDRIAYLDADAFPLTNIDDIFNQASVRSCDESKLTPDDYLPDQQPLCENYVFAGVPQDAFKPDGMVNGGALLFTPSVRMHQRLIQNYPKMDRYDVSLVEQGLLSWQFAHDGPTPGSALNREWGAYFPREEEEGQLKVVHQKIWMIEDGWMKKDWDNTWFEMMFFYNSPEFLEARKNSGVSSFPA